MEFISYQSRVQKHNKINKKVKLFENIINLGASKQVKSHNLDTFSSVFSGIFL